MTAAIDHARSSIGRRWILLGVLALALAALPASAQALHIPGATYTGTFSGGGTVDFSVTPTGDAVTGFHVANASGQGCTILEATAGGQTPIVNHAFNVTSSLFNFSGKFNDVQGAVGTFGTNQAAGCSTGTLNWTATTSASPAGSEECIDAKQDVKKAKKKVKKAKNAVEDADDADERDEAKKKLKKAKKKLNHAKDDQEAFC